MTSPEEIPDRCWNKVVADDNGCWIWTGSQKQSEGYGGVHINGRQKPAHRVFYEALVGPIPEGLVIDHHCENPPCVNPDHLEPVTQRVNILRGRGTGALNAVKTHCKRGHEFTPENTDIYYDGKRRCRTCVRKQSRLYKAELRRLAREAAAA